ncbi:MAG: DNA photolyase family protein [Thermoflexales bacterium]|nr:DNA photolyase family protein [Thermoflexales bacterium]
MARYRRLIVWFRRDLRVHDHAALAHACQDADEVIPVFILDPTQLAHDEVGSGRVKFLLECLADLDRSLIARGSYLTLLRGRAEEVLPRFVHCVSAQGVYYSLDIERWSGQVRDRALAQRFAREGIVFRGFLNYYLQLEGEYDRERWHAEWMRFSKQPLYEPPARVPTPENVSCSSVPSFGYIPTLRDLGLPPSTQRLPLGGESAARARLQTFLETRIATYLRCISSPSLAEEDGTSHLSPYLKFGCLSVRTCVQAARQRYLAAPPAVRRNLQAWASRLQWRDHFIQKFALYPEAEFVNLYRPFDALRRYEDADPKLLAAWQEGRTGFPLVDASMRALRETGWLNFRMRAMLATFLTLNLMIHWRHGAEWFMKHLVDGDTCIDHWQWQMQAGITQPSRPFLRAYNPLKQCYDHDAEARFIHKYVPELRALPAPLVFEPHRLTPLEQSWYGVHPGRDYPLPIVDAEATRKAAIEALMPIREQLAQAEREGRLDEYRNRMPGVTPWLTASKTSEPTNALALGELEEEA